jgi:NTE family protein
MNPCTSPRGLFGARAEKTISLALQGGGAHGAYTWGVLDYFLEDGRLAIEAISGTSAGAMNAVVLMEGWIEGGVDGARHQLEQFWQKISIDGSLTDSQRGLFGSIFGFWNLDSANTFLAMDLWSRVLSPYDSNPLNINPLKDVLSELIDFKKIQSCTSVKLFLAATNVWTGKIRLFSNSEIRAEHVLASACLPTLFQAIDIDGEPYWDGGYAGNPALYPLFYEVQTDDIILVQINPIERRETPRTAQEIQSRLTEITFNGTLLRELRAIDFVKRLIQKGCLQEQSYKDVLMHRIPAPDALSAFPAQTRVQAGWPFFQELRDLGRESAKAWLEENYDAIGTHSTFDIREEIEAPQPKRIAP